MLNGLFPFIFDTLKRLIERMCLNAKWVENLNIFILIMDNIQKVI